MRSLNRQSRPVQSPVTQLALDEQMSWEAEREQRFAHRPVGTQPKWVDLSSPWAR